MSDLDNNNKDPINNNELNLEKLSERQELEDDILKVKCTLMACEKLIFWNDFNGWEAY